MSFEEEQNVLSSRAYDLSKEITVEVEPTPLEEFRTLTPQQRAEALRYATLMVKSRSDLTQAEDLITSKDKQIKLLEIERDSYREKMMDAQRDCAKAEATAGDCRVKVAEMRTRMEAMFGNIQHLHKEFKDYLEDMKNA